MKISEEHFNFLYNNYSQELFNIAYGFTKNENDANDLVQETFLKLLLLNKEFKSNLDIKYIFKYLVFTFSHTFFFQNININIITTFIVYYFYFQYYCI